MVLRQVLNETWSVLDSTFARRTLHTIIRKLRYIPPHEGLQMLGLNLKIREVFRRFNGLQLGWQKAGWLLDVFFREKNVTH